MWTRRERRTSRRMFSVVATLGLVAAMLGGVALASIPDGSGLIHGCYAKKGGNLAVIDTATTW